MGQLTGTSSDGLTVRQLIEWAAGCMEQAGLCYHHGTDNALDEAAWLVGHSLGIPPDAPAEVYDGIPDLPARQAVIELIEQRIRTRKPAAYLTGEAWFAGLPFHCDERALVPRSPLAELIEDGFAPWIEGSRVHRILDLCTGSGCIGIACASLMPDVEVTASDISAAALELAARNVRRHGVQQRVRLCRADLFEGLAGPAFDIIVSNPPYVSNSEVDTLAAEFGYEPRLGLAAGSDGMDLVVRILRDAADWLTGRGILVVEVGYSREVLTGLYPGVPFTWLEFARGGDGVFLLEREQLLRYRQVFEQAADRRGMNSNEQEEAGTHEPAGQDC